MKLAEIYGSTFIVAHVVGHNYFARHVPAVLEDGEQLKFPLERFHFHGRIVLHVFSVNLYKEGVSSRF